MSLEAEVGALLTTRGLTLAVAESCTGGLILHRLTNVPGSSTYVLGGVVAYSNEAKEKFLQVNPGALEQYGAVSEEIAQEMAQGARAAFASDLAVSVTGIAGPGGGTESKPVGLTYVGLSSRDSEQVVRYIWDGDREQNKIASAEAALQLLYDYLITS